MTVGNDPPSGEGGYGRTGRPPSGDGGYGCVSQEDHHLAKVATGAQEEPPSGDGGYVRTGRTTFWRRWLRVAKVATD